MTIDQSLFQELERGSTNPHSNQHLQLQQFQQKLQDKQKEQDLAEEWAKSNLRVGGTKKGGPGSPPPILKYLRIRIRNLFHVPLSVLNKSACILSDQAFIEVLPIAWELLR